MEEGRFSGIVKPKEEEFGVLVEQPKRGENIPDCGIGRVSTFNKGSRELAVNGRQHAESLGDDLHQLMMNMMEGWHVVWKVCAGKAVNRVK